MDIISFNEGATANGRIEIINANPDSTSGIVTVPKTIASGETVTVPAGRVAVLPNVQVDGTLNVEGEVFIPSGATFGDLEAQIALKADTSYVNNKYSGFKNYIINGNFDVWQRGTSQTTGEYGSDDRWYNGHQSSAKTHSRVTCTDIERALFNANYFSRTVVSSVSNVIGFATKRQTVEDVTRLAGKTITVSFWAKADGNKKLWIEHKMLYGTGGTPSTPITGDKVQEFNLSNTWTKYQYTMTLPSIVGKTLGTDGVHTSGTDLQFWFDVGSSYTTRIPTGFQQSGTFDIAQVQLEEGSVATPFEQRPYGLELSLCQRYYQPFVNNGVLGELYSHERTVSTATGLTYITNPISFKVPMRTTPTVTIPRVYNQGVDYDTGWNCYTTGLNYGRGGIAIYKDININASQIIAFDAIASAEL